MIIADRVILLASQQSQGEIAKKLLQFKQLESDDDYDDDDKDDNWGSRETAIIPQIAAYISHPEECLSQKICSPTITFPPHHASS